MMYYYCPIEIDANFEGIVEIDNFFKKTNYLNQEMSKEKALSYVKNSLLSLYKDENDEMVSPALLYYMALGKEKRYQMLKVSMKTNELKLRYGFNITDGLLNDIMKANDIKKIIKKV